MKGRTTRERHQSVSGAAERGARHAMENVSQYVGHCRERIFPYESRTAHDGARLSRLRICRGAGGPWIFRIVRCMDDTTYRQLDRDPGSSKTMFMGHRRWLRNDDSWRKHKDLFAGETEPRRRPRTRRDEEIDELLKNWKD